MKKNISIYVIITLLACALTGTITYILVDKKDNKNDIKENNNNQNNNEENNNQNEEPTKQDGVKLLRTYNLNDKIIEEFEITLNGKTSNEKVEFDYKKDNFMSEISGVFKNNIFYLQDYIDNEEINKIYTKDKIFSTNAIKNDFNENNFKIIKGEDNKNYLAMVFIGDYDTEYAGEVYIYDDSFNLLSNNLIPDDNSGMTGLIINKPYNNVCGLENNAKPFYEDTFNVKMAKEQIELKIENDKIYYLVPVFKNNSHENGVLEERVYTINNSKLEYKVINTYKITQLCQEI